MDRQIINDAGVVASILENWNKSVAVIASDDKKVKVQNKAIEVWTIRDAMEIHYGEDIRYLAMMGIDMLCYAAKNNLGIVVNGFKTNKSVVAAAEDIEKYAGEIMFINDLVDYTNSEIEFDVLWDKIKNNEIYIIGDMPTMFKKAKYGIHSVPLKDKPYNMIPVFINMRHAETYIEELSEKPPVTKTTLKNLCKFYKDYAACIEPKSKYVVEICLEDN